MKSFTIFTTGLNKPTRLIALTSSNTYMNYMQAARLNTSL